ncbi:hypothetical protein AB4Y63_02030 [Leifsonia sp. YAF41]|uniref:hypothetical protein n=1 Tax=Leifsonia sp. YAF41 TaxID=3233086 RepID=UPI003F950CCE
MTEQRPPTAPRGGSGGFPRRRLLLGVGVLVGIAAIAAGALFNARSLEGKAVDNGQYPLHTDIVATTFWVGEVFDPNASDGSQVISTYDSLWLQSYGGCDGVIVAGTCQTEARTPGNGYFPTSMKPQQNPFYLDLPFDDVNDPHAAAIRSDVIPWAHDAAYTALAADPNSSLMKNRWVQITSHGQTCYGQIEDAGPGVYDDANYVFGTGDARPANTKFNGAGMDVSPALNGCLRFTDLNGENDRVNWRFVEEKDVPAGPWLTIVTRSGVR